MGQFGPKRGQNEVLCFFHGQNDFFLSNAAYYDRGLQYLEGSGGWSAVKTLFAVWKWAQLVPESGQNEFFFHFHGQNTLIGLAQRVHMNPAQSVGLSVCLPVCDKSSHTFSHNFFLTFCIKFAWSLCNKVTCLDFRKKNAFTQNGPFRAKKRFRPMSCSECISFCRFCILWLEITISRT